MNEITEATRKRQKKLPLHKKQKKATRAIPEHFRRKYPGEKQIKGKSWKRLKKKGRKKTARTILGKKGCKRIGKSLRSMGRNILKELFRKKGAEKDFGSHFREKA